MISANQEVQIRAKIYCSHKSLGSQFKEMLLPESVQGMSVGDVAASLVAVLTGIQLLTSADPIGRSLRLLHHFNGQVGFTVGCS